MGSQDFDAFDTIVNLTSAQCSGLRAAGVTTVLRYLAHSSSIGKILHPVEAATIRASGLRLVQNWEQSATTLLTASTDTLRGWAIEAAGSAIACGAQVGDVIPLSVDFDVTPAQWDGVLAGHLGVFAGVLRQSGLAATVYGSGYACRRALEAGYPAPWQAMSTGWRESSTTVPGVALRQLRQQTVAGVSGDVNKIVAGSWAGPAVGGSMTGPTTTDIKIAVLGGPSSLTVDELAELIIDGHDPRPASVSGLPTGKTGKGIADVLAAIKDLSVAGGGISDADRTLLTTVVESVDRLEATLARMAAAVPTPV